jgi:hypothetical protein
MSHTNALNTSNTKQKPVLQSRIGEQIYSRTKALDIIDWQSTEVNNVQGNMNQLSKSEIYDQLGNINARVREK